MRQAYSHERTAHRTRHASIPFAARWAKIVHALGIGIGHVTDVACRQSAPAALGVSSRAPAWGVRPVRPARTSNVIPCAGIVSAASQDDGRCPWWLGTDPGARPGVVTDAERSAGSGKGRSRSIGTLGHVLPGTEPCHRKKRSYSCLETRTRLLFAGSSTRF
jgi:hypothetical protein